MSALGQKRTFAPQKDVSALAPKADVRQRKINDCFGPKADIFLIHVKIICDMGDKYGASIDANLRD
jgi:hypothetical protein